MPVCRCRERHLDSAGAARTASLATRTEPPATGTAALETRSGQLVLPGESINLFDTTPAIACALATRTGGKLVYASALGGSAMIGYGSVATALDNCASCRAARTWVRSSPR